VSSHFYACPLCLSPIEQQQQSYVCSNKHSFDIAKQGYVNLLPVQQKKTKDPGDSKAMLQSRRRFLTQGFYDPLVDVIAQRLTALKPSSILDLGCGEGYYTQALVQQFKLADQQAQFLGLDIAKPAIMMAARSAQIQKDNSLFCIASSFRPPYLDESLDAVYTIFAPVDLHQLNRIIRPGGTWLRVTPGRNHLKQLKQAIYDELQDYQEHLTAPPYFSTQGEQRVQFSISLNQQQLSDLLTMTPFGWQLTEQKRAKLAMLSQLDLDCDFEIREYRKGG